MVRNRLDQRQIEWTVRHEVLQRHVELADGRTYCHRCTREIVERVLAYLDDHPQATFTMESIAEAIDAPYTQVNVILELLKERSIVETEGRKNFIAEGYRDGFYEEAMLEYLALEAGCPPQLRQEGAE